MRFDDLVIGQSADFAKTITETDVVLYAGLTGDMNPLHIDEVAARSSRFGGRVAHGMLTAGLISAVLGMKLPGPGAIYLSQWLQFTRPVHIGDTITAKVAVAGLFPEKRRAKLATTCTNQDGKTVIEGEAMVLLP